MFSRIPKGQGMYDPIFEKDACGIGAITHIKGKKSHGIVKDALKVLVNLEHRGGAGADIKVGDGAGILFQIPHKFFKKVCSFTLPEEREYGVGMFFLPMDEKKREEAKALFENIVLKEGQSFLGWREVPINPEDLGKASKEAMPFIIQGFVKRSEEIKDTNEFEKKLYVIRRTFEKSVEEAYVASLSSKTIVYKGMLTSKQVEEFYLDLKDVDLESAIALVHSRFSTNTFPSWDRAHPNRYIIHNGEINTIRGNVNWMNAREANFESDVFGDELEKVVPAIGRESSDSAMFDNSIEFLYMNGRPLPEVMMMLIPEPWSKNEEMAREKKDFYEYHSTMMEPWDGPAAVAFTDGDMLGACLDRNGLRPSRYYITEDDIMVLSSEVGVLEIDPSKVVKKGRLTPGRMLLVDTVKGEVINDEELKENYSKLKPYGEWISNNLVKLNKISDDSFEEENMDEFKRVILQKAFGYTYEDLTTTLAPMAENGDDPLAAMGIDTPLAVLSEKPQLLYNYFKQMFAQVTNPPIDAIREEIVTSVRVYLGGEGNLLSEGEKNCRRIKLNSPILTNKDLHKVLSLESEGFKHKILPIVFDKNAGEKGLESALERLFQDADNAIEEGASILVLSDKMVDENNVPIPALLATSALHHHLVRNCKRTKVSIVLESGEPREIHHFACLLGFGVNAINPYLAYESIKELIDKEMLKTDYEDAVYKYNKGALKGIVKVISKMGISTIQSYNGAQIFEAIGISKEVIEKYFTWTPSRIEGMQLEDIAKEALMRHIQGFDKLIVDLTLDSEGSHKFRSSKEEHMYNPLTIHKLQSACKNGSYEEFKEYTTLLGTDKNAMTLRGLLDFNYVENSIPLEEVESVESIVKRFKTGAMSYGSISKEAHECLAIAMNRIGGKSNSGEGGEESERFIRDENGDLRSSAIKQVASGRFGVTSEYLVDARELQIKVAQGAKPGEGGQLPATKVYPWVAKARHSTTGVGLISPPPHHDIYSIEDLAQLIYDLKNANTKARVSVKLVSEAGVGTIAAGVAKGGADVILISGYDGGTGASPKTSIKHAGLPWELGLAETHQTLVLNGLRERVTVETDGKLMSGRDLAIAALLGAEEFGFATAPLVVVGCVMMRVCNLDTCPVGVATQNEALRKRFAGKPEHVVNFMYFIAQELREYMAKLGFRTIEEMIGRTDKLKAKEVDSWKARKVDLSRVLYNPEVPNDKAVHFERYYDYKLEDTMDSKVLLEACKNALENGEKVTVEVESTNTDRVLGTILGSEITRRYGAKGLPEDTVTVKVTGSGGQSFGAFIPNGLTLELVGDCNDYLGKGLSGGKIIVYEPECSKLIPEENILIGNVALYGATQGKVFIKGVAGERFCVRNSGAYAVVEGVGDHACEYMTGGRVVVLGSIGRNFAAGMSGGVAYILDEEGTKANRINKEMINIEAVECEDEQELLSMVKEHYEVTNSSLAKRVVDNFDTLKHKFIKVMPRDYKKMVTVIKKYEASGLSEDAAMLAAFEEICGVKK
ncbi:glutamate synthase subunit alpha [Clostridium polyendosporum]|uniref:Glutamate synthase subunit alpha n=1 Tax=Clostridium polyendosporum TaxID=69208 RepID=A0A919RW02_9CLOT|nr:glutamate synthase large subunit [Clostridium polyendosporum]GIM27426.1 glutamate synthase subunit alpha [Clostridium polyendosporum]